MMSTTTKHTQYTQWGRQLPPYVCLSVLEELSHVLVDQVRSILLYPVTAVRDVPVRREEGWGEERDRGRGWRGRGMEGGKSYTTTP